VSLFEADPPGVGLPNQRHISRMHSSTAAVH
jgi:hypothetical protein